MSAFKGTPGPWRPSRNGPSGLTYGIEAGPSHDPVKIVKWGGIGRPSSETGQANARLIAAAPDLLGQHEADMVDLDLLAKAIHAGDPMPELVIRVTDMLNRKRAVIAKATGEQP